MIVAVITALLTLFYISIWLIVTAYAGWGMSGSRRFAYLVGGAGVVLFLTGVALSLRVVLALVGAI